MALPLLHKVYNQPWRVELPSTGNTSPADGAACEGSAIEPGPGVVRDEFLDVGPGGRTLARIPSAVAVQVKGRGSVFQEARKSSARTTTNR